MSFDIAAQTGVTAVRPGMEIDVGALAGWMADRVEGFRGPLTLSQFKGGQSNPTYLLTTPTRTYVLRRKPPGETLKGAHAVDREARVISALYDAGFPVPRIFGLCVDAAVIGSWFYVMDHVQGRIFWDARLPDIAAADRPAYFDAMNRTIAQLHGLDHQAAGLSDYGRPADYFARQIARWSRQYLEDEAAGRDPNMDRLIEWLPSRIPAGEETAVVHGDFRIDNMIFDPTEPRVLAVLDWELSTLGHPLADFAYHAMMYRMPPLIVPGLAGADLDALNIPPEDAYVAAYCRHSGRDALPGYAFAMAFNFFRFAAIIHGIKGRYLRGTAVNAEAKSRAEAFPAMAELAWRQALAADRPSD
ncbi:MAG: phosphotransferase [Sphingobium sp.]|uniref:phosphotransferase n=1 Tax=Sphingobium sp. TaxID=1912891 RepID=UPI002E1FCA10